MLKQAFRLRGVYFQLGARRAFSILTAPRVQPLDDVFNRVSKKADEAMGTIFGTIDVETPPYDVLLAVESKDGRPAYELRRYGALYAVETNMGTGEGGAFRRLAGYIGVGGNPRNKTQKPVAMTAPVVTRAGDTSSETIAMTAPVVSKGQVMVSKIEECSVCGTSSSR